jgi:hypothetical protein
MRGKINTRARPRNYNIQRKRALRRAKQVPEIVNKSILYFINRGGKGTVTKLNNRDEILSMSLTHEGMEER